MGCGIFARNRPNEDNTVILSLTASAMLFAMAAAAADEPAQDETAKATPASTETANPDDKIKCRRVDVTGSLVRSEKVCKTIGEWRRLREGGNDNARDIIDYSRSRPAGN